MCIQDECVSCRSLRISTYPHTHTYVHNSVVEKVLQYCADDWLVVMLLL